MTEFDKNYFCLSVIAGSRPCLPATWNVYCCYQGKDTVSSFLYLYFPSFLKWFRFIVDSVVTVILNDTTGVWPRHRIR
jgi:hypothetical protein